VFYGSTASIGDEPKREDVDLCEELLVWCLGATVLCERGALRARYAGTVDEPRGIQILLSLAAEEEVE
jgi:hypothetical protein